MSGQQYAQTEEYAEMMAYLVEELGVEPREAEIALRDGDLWPRIEAGSMYPFEGEEAVALWEDARRELGKLYEFYAFDNPAVLQILSEGMEVAEEQLKRARERVGEAS